MAEAFVRTLKRDYVRVSPRPNAQTVIDQLPGWLDHYNEVHPHRALGYRSPREFIDAKPARPCQAFRGQQHKRPRSQEQNIPRAPRPEAPEAKQPGLG